MVASRHKQKTKGNHKTPIIDPNIARQINSGNKVISQCVNPISYDSENPA